MVSKLHLRVIQGIIIGSGRTMDNLSVFLATGWKFGLLHSIYCQNITKMSEEVFRPRGSKVALHIA